MAWRMPKKIFRNMEKKRLEMKVGLFVLVGLALMAVLMVQFSKGTSLFRGTYTLKLRASNIGGLKAKTGVLLAGVQVGTVSAVKLDPSGTNVTIHIATPDADSFRRSESYITGQIARAVARGQRSL